MTATKVNGRRVVAERPIRSPLWKPTNPVTFTRFVELELSNGTTVVGCVECEFTDPKVGVVRQHLRQAHPRQAAPVTPLPVGAHARNGWRSLTLGEAVRMAGELERARTDMYAWRTRAQRAEADLAAIRRAVSPKEQ